MEKIDVLVWEPASIDAAKRLDLPGLQRLAVSTRADVKDPPLLMGKGPDLAGLVEVWVDCVDVWRDIQAQVRGDAYLVTESVPQRPAERQGLLTHLSFFPKPERLSEEEFFHGWHDIHTPSSAKLHPRRQGYVRDAVARTLTPGSPPVRAIVSELFEKDDYLDPARLFAVEELETTMRELPLYADSDDLSCVPLWRTVIR
jgi:hypothetical protein